MIYYAIVVHHPGRKAGQFPPTYLPSLGETLAALIARVIATETEQTGQPVDPLTFRITLLEVSGPAMLT